MSSILTASNALLQQLDEAVIHYRSLTFAETTKQSYRTHLNTYMQYCELSGQSPVPITHQGLCRYVAFLASRLSFNSIGKYMNIIRILHQEAGLSNPLSNNWILNSVMKGIRRDKGTVTKTKLPITPQILLRLRTRLCFGKPVDIVFWAACMVAFYGLLRKSNLLPPSAHSFDSRKHLCKNNLCITQHGYDLSVYWSKTIQNKERVLHLVLPIVPGHLLCPVAAVTNLLYLNRHSDPSSPLFSFPTPTGLHVYTQKEFLARLQKVLNSCDLSDKEYSGHSFRKGGATWAFASGIPSDVIKLMGDWRSEAYQRYLQPTVTMKFQLAKQFINCLPPT